MLQDVWHSRVIWRISLETDGEDIIRIFPSYVKILGSSFVMVKLQRGQLELGDVLRSLQSEAM